MSCFTKLDATSNSCELATVITLLENTYTCVLCAPALVFHNGVHSGMVFTLK